MSGNITSMSQFTETKRYSSLRQVAQYWQDLRRGQLVPFRSEVDPRGIEEALPYAFIAERVASGLARLRIAGTHLADLMGMDVRGMPLSTLFTSEARRTLQDTLIAVFDRPSIATVTLRSPASLGRPAIEAKLILLPLRNDMGDVARVLGCLEATGRVGATPRRFDIVDVDIVALEEKAPMVSPEPEKPVAGFAEQPTPFTRAAHKGRPPYLRLVHSRDD